VSRRNIDTGGQLSFGLGDSDPLTISLQDSFDCWDHLNEYGGQDPFWADGMNMNIVRSHIMYYKSQMEDKFGSGEYPDIYYRDTPPEVSPDFMAVPDRIRADAATALQIIEADDNLKFIRETIDGLTDKQRQALCVGAVLGYVQKLKHCIAENDLVSMRRYRDPQWGCWIRFSALQLGCLNRYRSMFHHRNWRTAKKNMKMKNVKPMRFPSRKLPPRVRKNPRNPCNFHSSDGEVI